VPVTTTMRVFLVASPSTVNLLQMRLHYQRFFPCGTPPRLHFRLNYKLSPRRSRVIIIPESKQHYVSDKIGGFGGRATFINEALCWLRRECCNDWQACGRQLDVPEFSSESLHGWWMNAPWISQKGHLAVIAMNWHPQRSPSWRQQILCHIMLVC